MPVSVASVTTAYNAVRLLPPQLEALLRQTRRLDEIIVVDNQSQDGTAAMLAERYPQVTLLRLPQNRGAAGAWATGLAYAALEKKHDWVWALDDDSVPGNDAVEGLLAAIQAFEGPACDLGMVCAQPVHPGTGDRYPPLLWREGFVKPPPATFVHPLWFADLAFMSGSMTRRELVAEIGLPRSDFFMDFFDFEYCLRARSRGYKIAVVPVVRMAHEVGEARVVRLPGFSGLWPNHPPWREYYMTRNLTYAVWWLYPSSRARRFVLRHLARHAGGMVLFGDHKLAGLRKMVQGFCDGRRARLGIRFLPSAHGSSLAAAGAATEPGGDGKSASSNPGAASLRNWPV